MEYRQLNSQNRNKMESICNSKIAIEWDDPELFDILLGKLPEIQSTEYDSKVKKLVDCLKEVLSSYDILITDNETFVNKIENLTKDIRKICPYWHGVNTFEIKDRLALQKACVIYGEGGIGKSYFIKCLEEKLESNEIEHLCIYGKFEKTIKNICEEELVSVAKKKPFVLIIDAVNEMAQNEQNKVLELVDRLIIEKGIRIILTYRTGALCKDIISKLKNMSLYYYRFPGVSFESALMQLSIVPIADVHKYEDILYSNNPMLLNMLYTILQNEKLIDSTRLNSVSMVTYILEQYIKVGLKSSELWDNTKAVASWMYDNNRKQIPEKDLFSLITNPASYVEKMTQQGFIGRYTSGEGIIYFFLIDTLTDYLLARNIMKQFDKEQLEESIKKLKEKLNMLYGFQEAAIVAIFDKFSPEYKLIKHILTETGLMVHLSHETLLKIKFKTEYIVPFLDIFKDIEAKELINYFGGYNDKPFNCVNFLNHYYLQSDDKQVRELSNQLSGNPVSGRIKERLKNILYFINIQKPSKEHLEESLYFALWCSAAPNSEIRCLAMKLMFDIITQEPGFKQSLIKVYANIKDEYIKEAVIYTICESEKTTQNDISFLKEIANNPEYLYAKDLRRIAKTFGDDYDYINWNKVNIYEERHNATISDEFKKLLFILDIYDGERDLLGFRYWSESHIDIYTKFLITNKHAIRELNRRIEKTFSCVKTGECSGSSKLEKIIRDYYCTEYNVELDPMSLLYSFEKIAKKIFEKFGIGFDDNNINHNTFSHSLLKKAVTIAHNILFGSMMCNYYTDSFASYNSEQNCIGYEVYDPIMYGENVRINSPIPVYQTNIEEMGDIIVSRMLLPNDDSNITEWVMDSNLTEDNLKIIMEPFEYNGDKWNLIAGRISLYKENKMDRIWQEHFDVWCCASEDIHINGTSNDRNLTIELNKYKENIFKYPNFADQPFLCEEVPTICTNLELFDETFLVLPPAKLINDLKLHLSLPAMVWENDKDEIVIICNNNRNSYYRDYIGGTVFLRNKEFEEYIRRHYLSFFAFSEKWTKSTGYPDETSFHFELSNGDIVKKYYNNAEKNGISADNISNRCDKCALSYKRDKSSDNLILERYNEICRNYIRNEN